MYGILNDAWSLFAAEPLLDGHASLLGGYLPNVYLQQIRIGGMNTDVSVRVEIIRKPVKSRLVDSL